MCELYKIVCNYEVLSFDYINEEDIISWEKVDSLLVDHYISIDDLVVYGHFCDTHGFELGKPIIYIIDINHKFYTYINNVNVRRFIRLSNLEV